MRIEYNMPVAGEHFSIRVYTSNIEVRSIKFSAFESRTKILIWEHECPDPPCHEHFRIPINFKRNYMILRISDKEELHELLFYFNEFGIGKLEKENIEKPKRNFETL